MEITTILQLSALFLIWYGYLAFEYALNSGQLGRGKNWVFECLVEDFHYFKKGGIKNRVARVKKMLEVDYHSVIIGSSRSWDSKENYTEEDYIKCANEVLENGTYFWLSRVIIPICIAFFILFY